MKIPMFPPHINEVLGKPSTDSEGMNRIMKILTKGIGPAPDGKYRHWDTLRHIKPPEGLTVEEWWAAIKLARSQTKREIPLKDKNGNVFHYTLPDPVLEMLHQIDKNASGRVELPESITNSQTRDRYIQSSLIEEAITSSQLEGAATTREVAKEMIRSGRKPLNNSERMILNNYLTMKFIRTLKNEKLSVELIERIHKKLTKSTFDNRNDYFRKPEDGIAVYDNTDNKLLHQPPNATEIPERLEALCNFANKAETGAFLHPVIKAIILHFWFAYDHPFVDGNGRTARALFYWSMLSQDFWLFEYVSISTILKQAPAKYGKSFLYTETDENDLTYFILSQLDVICRAIEQLYEYLERKVKEVRETASLLKPSADLNHREIALLSHALRHPGQHYTIESHKKSHGVTYQTARTDLLNLSEKKLLNKSKSGKAFVFTPANNLHERLKKIS